MTTITVFIVAALVMMSLLKDFFVRFSYDEWYAFMLFQAQVMVRDRSMTLFCDADSWCSDFL